MHTFFALLVIYVFVAGIGTLFRQVMTIVSWFIRTALSGRRVQVPKGQGE